MKVRIELFTANVCARCAKAQCTMNVLVEELDDDQFELNFVDIVENLDHAVEVGVLATPAARPPRCTETDAGQADGN